MNLSQLGSIHLPRDKGRVMRRKITELGIAGHWEQRAEREAGRKRRWEWGGGRGSSPWAGRVWQKGAGPQQRDSGGYKGQPCRHHHQIVCMLFAIFLLEDVTLPVRMFTFKSLIRSQDIEFPATAEALSTFCYYHKELPPVLNIFSGGEKGLKK